MNESDAQLDPSIRFALQSEAAAVNDVDLWPHVRQLIRSTARSRRTGHLVRASIVALTLALVAGTTVVASASSGARSSMAATAQDVARVVGIRMGNDGRTAAVTPTPGFRVLGPSYLPAGLVVHSVAYSPGRAASSRGSVTAVYTYGPAGSQATPDPAQVQVVGQTGLPTVDDRFSSSGGDRYVEIIQRPLTTPAPKPEGEIVAVGTTQGFLVSRGSDTIVTVEKSGVRVEIVTNLGPPVAIAVAGSLR
jgi:hypothetical protein